VSSEDSDGYVHTPESAPDADADADADADDEATESGGDAKGTVLLVAVAVATLVIPGIIYLYPPLLADRVPFLIAMLVLPFVPAVLLGTVAVWAMTE
jgi:hypothetical protein